MRHAALGYRFVKWALEGSSGPERATLHEALRREIDHLVVDEPMPGEDCTQTPLVDHGLLPAETRSAARRVALRDVVLPCARALLGETAAHAEMSIG